MVLAGDEPVSTVSRANIAVSDPRYYVPMRRLSACNFIHGWTEGVQLEHIYASVLDAPEGNFLEIGCYLGRSTVAICSALLDRGKGERLQIVDPFMAPSTDRGLIQDMGRVGGTRDDVCAKFLENMKLACIDNFDLNRSTSRHARVKKLVKGPLAFAFIDGDHSPEMVRHDLEWVVPMMVPGGIVAMDDYGVAEPKWGVREAVDELLVPFCGTHRRLGIDGRAWFGRIAS